MSRITTEPKENFSLNFRAAVWAVPTLIFLTAALLPAQIDNPTRQLSRDIFKELIEINTTDSVGNVTAAAEAMAKRLRRAGFAEDDLHVAGPSDSKKNLVVRLRST